MCLAIPAKVIEIKEQLATVDILGNQTTADISVLEDVQIGDYILVHAGFAIQKYDPLEGEENLKLVKELLSQTDSGSLPDECSCERQQHDKQHDKQQGQ